MRTKDKELLLKDLCGRLPYGVKVVDDMGRVCTLTLGNVDLCSMFYAEDFDQGNTPSVCKPYLRTMSSMTEEEKEELLKAVIGIEGIKYFQVLSDGSIDMTDEVVQDLNRFSMHWVNFDKDNVTSYLDWLNKNHFNYRLPEHLYVKVTKENNPYKE